MKLLIDILLLIKYDRILKYWSNILVKVKLRRYEIESGQKINFISQGNNNLSLLGDLKKFTIHPTSHIKSDTVIECTGGVVIGKYFHAGRGLTIFSANHNWEEASKIPYDELIIERPVIIEDFVWVGANVTILPGVSIEEGAIIAGGSVVTKNVKRGQVVGGNPAKVIKQRNIEIFDILKSQRKFY